MSPGAGGDAGRSPSEPLGHHRSPAPSTGTPPARGSQAHAGVVGGFRLRGCSVRGAAGRPGAGAGLRSPERHGVQPRGNTPPVGRAGEWGLGQVPLQGSGPSPLPHPTRHRTQGKKTPIVQAWSIWGSPPSAPCVGNVLTQDHIPLSAGSPSPALPAPSQTLDFFSFSVGDAHRGTGSARLTPPKCHS